MDKLDNNWDYEKVSNKKNLQVTICKYLIKLSVFAADAIILDTFAGGDTVLVAAKMLSKNYIGIDINTNYINIANKKLSDMEFQKEQQYSVL